MNAPADNQRHPIAVLRSDIKAALPTFGMPDQRSQERMSSVLMVAVEKDPQLINADRASLIAAVRQCAAHGLVPDGNEATLQVYNTKQKNGGWIQKVQYQPMVRGIINRVLNSGKVQSFWAELVYEGEEFSIDMSQGDRRPKHSPDYFNRDGNIIGVYAVAKMANGTVDCEPMTRKEIDKVRGVAKTQKVWDNWFEEKAKVAVMRRMSKRLPLSSEDMAMIMNEQEHDFDAQPQKAPESEKKQTLAQKLAEQAGGDHDETQTVDGRITDPDAVEDAETVDEHKYDPEGVDPFTDEYAEGIEAFKAGKVERDCPHPVNTFEHNNWLGGWLFGMKASDGEEKE